MNYKAMTILASCMLYSGIANISSWINNKIFGKSIRILCVHKVINLINRNDALKQIYLRIGHLELADFEKKLKFMKEKYNVISFNEYLDRCECGDDLPYNSFVLTFDDGDLEHYTKVYPILKTLGIPATFFIPTAYISSNHCKWDDTIAALIAGTKLKVVGIDSSLLGKKAFKIETIEEKAQVVYYLWRTLKYVSESIRKNFIQQLEEILHTRDSDFEPVYPKVMTWEHIRTIAKDPLISIGAHTQTHPVLTILKDNEIKDELSGSKREIEQNIEKPVTLFSYPFGKLTDFDERIKKIAKEVGFRAACTFCYGRNDRKVDRFALRRIPLLAESLPMFRTRMSGIFDFISKRREKNNG